ncbi:RNA polymerase II C-terminal domain phosphatase-like 4 [Vitis vinifera]|uniref:protein-serine/threonine phosphatase n=1 Tax=Vitis vinifera TaxID=29760 RepID=A0A438JTV6_VITVI|nr:RNA polymerase II C-terminal domain phosphatase-like 4 [Vitis vinifera]
MLCLLPFMLFPVGQPWTTDGILSWLFTSKETSKMFEMYVYTMGEQFYALEMVKVLDPRTVYFSSSVISQADSTQRHQKGLDVKKIKSTAFFTGKIKSATVYPANSWESPVVASEFYVPVDNLSSHLGSYIKQVSDESEPDGALATILKVLQQTHSTLFDPELSDNFSGRDVRQVRSSESIRRAVQKGCKIVFTRVFPAKFQADNHPLWKMAEQLEPHANRT